MNRDGHDRIVDQGLREVHGETPPDLLPRTLEQLDMSPSEPPAAPRTRSERVQTFLRRFRRSRSSPARSLMIAGAVCIAFVVALPFLLWPAASDFETHGGGTQPEPGGTVLVTARLGTLACTTGRLWKGTRHERSMTTTVGEARSWDLSKDDRLSALGAESLDIWLQPFGVVTTTPHTEMEVRSMESSMKNGVVTAGAVTFAVIAGVVTWRTLDKTAKAEAGQQIRMEAQQDGGAGIASMSEKLTALEKELTDAKQRNQQLEAQLSRRAAEKQEPAAPEPVAAAANGPGTAAFMDPKFEALLRSIDWQALGGVSGEMAPKLAELVAKLGNGENDQALAIEVNKLNAKLLDLVPKLVEAKVPGLGANSAYTHPLVTANLLSGLLAKNGQQLTSNQRAEMESLVRTYTAENDAILAQPREFELEGLIAENAMKDRFFEQTAGMLTPEQQALMNPEGSKASDGANLFDTGLVWFHHGNSVQATTAESFAKTTGQRLEYALRLDETTATQVRQIIERVSASQSALWSSPASKLEADQMPFRKRGRVAAAAQAQVLWMREISRSVNLTEAQRKKLKGMMQVYVPLP